ncbi:MAG: response regulator transcription factor [Lachnospiraceae bacterium]|nr:response regulator transcription factor [Lachnospiraceae bacterium]
MQRILVVEDDYGLNKAICYALEKDGYEAVSVHSIKEAEEAYKKERIHFIILDVNLPDGEGFSFCKWVQDKKSVPFLFLTARDLEEDALKGYELGAEDYVTKPFSMRILLKKIGIILRHSVVEDGPDFEDEYLTVDFECAKVTVNGEKVNLTPTEFRLLRQFVFHKGQLLTYEILLERLWDSDGQFVDKHTLAVNINRLRSKIESEEHKYISNVYGMGYQWIGS